MSLQLDMVRKFIFSLLVGFCLLGNDCHATPLGFAEGSFISDTQTEDLFNKWLQDIFNHIGLQSYKPRIHIMVSPQMNAAATTGGEMMITTGLIAKASSGLQVYGILCHEAGHIKKGHVSQMDHQQRSALGPAIVAVILGGLATAAGGSPEALAAGAAAGQDIFVRQLMKGMQGFEIEADFLALDVLRKKNYSAKGLSDFFTNRESKISKIFKSEYAAYNTHPMSEERVSNFNRHISQHDRMTVPFPDEVAFKLLQEKYQGYFSEQLSLPLIPTTMTQAAKTFRNGDYEHSLQLIQQALLSSPSNPYLLEMKAQIYAESGRLTQAIQTLNQIPQSQQGKNVKLQKIHYFLESQTLSAPGDIEQMLQQLKSMTMDERSDSFTWYLLAKVYALKASRNHDQQALLWADYATARFLFAKGEIDAALRKCEVVIKKTSDSRLKGLSQDLAHQMNDLKKS